MPSKKILIIAEGEKLEVELFTQLQKLSLIENSEIVSYAANIHNLREKISDRIDDPDFSLLMILAEKELDTICTLNKKFSDGLSDTNKQSIQKALERAERNYEKLTQVYTDVLLVFDLDPHDKRYQDPTFKKQYLKIVKFFADSTDQGQLYLSYPMVEALFDNCGTHWKIKDIKNQYKKQMQSRSLFQRFKAGTLQNHNYIEILKQHWQFAQAHFKQNSSESIMFNIYNAQAEFCLQNNYVLVLSTALFFLIDYHGLKILDELEKNTQK